jgi:DNA polymerase-3 subunit epsilon
MRKLLLERPLISFDLETTGLNSAKDKIVQISLSKITYQNDVYHHIDYNWYLNPGIPIPPEVTEIHGITDEDVKDKMMFKDVAEEIYDIMKGCDLLGYNSNRFDIPFLAEEFIKCGITYPEEDTKMVDAQVIFHKREPRDLAAALMLYKGEELKDAHDARVDMKATIKILFGQLEKYPDLPDTIEGLHEESSRGEKLVDYAGKLAYNENGEVVFNFGADKGQRIVDNKNFANWMLKKDFPEYTKMCVRRELGLIQPEIKPDTNHLAF